MIKLKKIKLINYCGYRNFELDIDQNNKWIILYGPNGSFKSSFLEAVELLSSPHRFMGRDNSLFFRKMTYHPDYRPGTESFNRNRTSLYMMGLFSTDEGDKEVVIINDHIQDISGTTINELGDKYRDPCVFIDADNPMNMCRFQLIREYREKFIDIAEEVYKFKCEIPDKIQDIVIDSGIEFCTDFIITKYNNVKVHFKRMSAGEKKIATMLRTLFNRCCGEDSSNRNNIILIDNIDMHIYFKRHMKLINKLKEHFPSQQFIITTHSPVIIDGCKKDILLDMEGIHG